MKKYLHLIVPAVAVILCSLFLFSSSDHKVNDVFMKTLRPLKESKKVIMVAVDDGSIAQIGTFPWTRDILADTIVYLREHGAESVVFDLSYLDKSPQKVDPNYVNKELPEYVDFDFKKINDSMSQVLDAFKDKTLGPSDAEASKQELIAVNNGVKNELNTSISYVTKDMDIYLADCLKFFNNSYLTLDGGALDTEDIDKDYLAGHIALNNIVSDGD